MSTTWRPLAEDPRGGWSAVAITCRAGPADRPFEECHGRSCIAVVTKGTFGYRSTLGDAELAPGGVMLGNAGQVYECGHDHSWGDTCIAFHYDEALLDTICRDLPGIRQRRFARPHLPPLESLLPLAAQAEALAAAPDPAALEELALALAGAVLAGQEGAPPVPRSPGAKDRRRVAEALQRLEREQAEPLSLEALAASAGVSSFHFLRSFAAIVGTTPYRYLLRARMQHAAVALRLTAEPVAAIAFDAGFGDLSTFNNRFRRQFGMTPTAWRRQAGRRARIDGQGPAGRSAIQKPSRSFAVTACTVRPDCSCTS
ncbi:helix-turn-helix transcriptional regulator [Marinibaculum pumilum]|uniref:Helix-turn-helix transcriptional regulator n=1 Tax=Marinibaculum pumilum TaxID=1766165 RepID=A0ABV7LAY8_9PROT